MTSGLNLRDSELNLTDAEVNLATSGLNLSALGLNLTNYKSRSQAPRFMMEEVTKKAQKAKKDDQPTLLSE